MSFFRRAYVINDPYARTDNSKPRREAILFGTDAYQDAIESIMDKIGPRAFEVSCYQNELESLKEAVEGEDVAD